MCDLQIGLMFSDLWKSQCAEFPQISVATMTTNLNVTRIEVDRLIGQPIVLQIKPINIQARLQATRDAASCGKQIAIPLAQQITLWCPPLPRDGYR